MDFDLPRGEQFLSYLTPYSSDLLDLDGIENLTSTNLLGWNNFDQEIELCEDMGVLPSNQYSTTNTSGAGSSYKDFEKIMNDWQELVDVESNCDDFVIEDSVITPEENGSIFNLSDKNAFDITTYLKEEPSTPAPYLTPRKPRVGVKKIDLERQRYIVDDDEGEVDVETISELGESSPVLEAGDLNSLLEQFEATELPELPECLENHSAVSNLDVKHTNKGAHLQNNILKEDSVICKPEVVKVKQEFVSSTPIHTTGKYLGSENSNSRIFLNVKIKKEDENPEVYSENIEVKFDIGKCGHEQLPNLKQESDSIVRSKEDILLIKTEDKAHTPKHVQFPSSNEHSHNANSVFVNINSTTSLPLDTAKHKQIVNALPQELIDRIKESGKRKPISVIPPIVPTKKHRKNGQDVRLQMNHQKAFNVARYTVQLDHDYCSQKLKHSGNQKKDSGFESAEEEEPQTIGKQPMIKNADGKLMVSLLKANTIRSEQVNKKRKLNLEEYKKRREGVLKSQSSSQNNSPMSSTCSSPLPEDDSLRIKKHQEKLMRMAMEVLNTPRKSDIKLEPTLVITPPKIVDIPADMERKTLVSIGVNTDLKPRRNLDPLAPVEQLEEIKPLLKQASDKINCNSLITSLIENIPKVINSCRPTEESAERDPKSGQEHGEDKTIVFLPKERVQIQTRDVETQTNISLIQQSKPSRYRRRRTSSSSSSSYNSGRRSRGSSRYGRWHKPSEGSGVSSRSSSSSSSSYSRSSSYSSRSRSRSSSPRFSRRTKEQERERRQQKKERREQEKDRREQERLREVEERRVIYVGRIGRCTVRDDLRKRFQKFGPITNVSLHSREQGDNYGFVTFANKLDAYEAIEHGNDDPHYPKYDLSFGGRRIFCKTSYADLDNVRDETGYYAPPRTNDDSFDALLREAQEKLRKRRA